MTPTIHAGLKAELPGAEIVDGYPTLLEAKMIKTDDEIACLKIATAITEAGYQAALDFLKPGVRECEVLAAAWQKMTALGSEWTQCSNIVASGPYTAPYRRLTSDRIIRRGDLVIMDIGGCYNGYWGDMTRTWICGDVVADRPPDRAAPEGLRRALQRLLGGEARQHQRRCLRGGGRRRSSATASATAPASRRGSRRTSAAQSADDPVDLRAGDGDEPRAVRGRDRGRRLPGREQPRRHGRTGPRSTRRSRSRSGSSTRCTRWTRRPPARDRRRRHAASLRRPRARAHDARAARCRGRRRGRRR